MLENEIADIVKFTAEKDLEADFQTKLKTKLFERIFKPAFRPVHDSIRLIDSEVAQQNLDRSTSSSPIKTSESG